MNPGELNKRVTLLFPTGSIGEDGELNYIPGDSVWAAFDVKSPSGRVIVTNNMEAPISTRWIKIRYRESIDSTWRIKYGEQTFEINQPPIDMGMQHRELYLELRLM